MIDPRALQDYETRMYLRWERTTLLRETGRAKRIIQAPQRRVAALWRSLSRS